MGQILYQYPLQWPDEGPLQLDMNLAIRGEIEISPDSARQRAKGCSLGRVHARLAR